MFLELVLPKMFLNIVQEVSDNSHLPLRKIFKYGICFLGGIWNVLCNYIEAVGREGNVGYQNCRLVRTYTK